MPGAFGREAAGATVAPELSKRQVGAGLMLLFCNAVSVGCIAPVLLLRLALVRTARPRVGQLAGHHSRVCVCVCVVR